MYRVVIAGRPNVGKSSLFNRIAGKRQAITERVPGTTRDYVEARVTRFGDPFMLVDTGGYEFDNSDHLTSLVKKQIASALDDADLVVFVGDINDGPGPQDEEIAALLRKTGKEIVMVANKADNEEADERAHEFYTLGFSPVYAVSALHKRGMDALMERINESVPAPEESEGHTPGQIRVAVVGRPNVGKSSFVNRVCGSDRAIVHDSPGTTRDSLDIHVTVEGKDYLLIDTAGMRHKRKITSPVDVYSLLRAEQSIRKCDVCVVMIDAYEGLRRDDMRILDLVKTKGRGAVLAVNKWDKVESPDISRYTERLIEKMAFIETLPVIVTSCLTSKNVDDVFRLVSLVWRNMNIRLERHDLKALFDGETGAFMPQVRSGKNIRVFAVTQTRTSPPSFTAVVNNPGNVTEDFVRRMQNVIRNEYSLLGTPLRITFKKAVGRKGTKANRGGNT